MRPFLVFVAAAVVLTAAASFRFGDSAHAMGIASVSGGHVRHAAVLAPGRDRYVVIATATVAPPYTGDVSVSVEGDEGFRWNVHLTAPVVDLGLHRRPRMLDRTLLDVRPRDRLALWFVLRPGGPGTAAAGTSLRIVLRDDVTGREVLAIPVEFRAGGGGNDAG